jgi:tryptophan-rich sensory protein
MGVSLFLIWRRRLETDKSKNAILAFTIQLALNVLWSIIFFGLKSPPVAFVEILILWLAIFFTIRIFAKISKPAAWLLIPYILWVSFAMVLNYFIWAFN